MADDAPVKMESEISTPALDDDDLYEDAGDLEFYDPVTQPHLNSVYLARIPKSLWKVWSQMDDDQEIEIGTLRQWYEPDKNGNPTAHMRMLLNPNLPQHQPIPREYSLDIGADVSSEFVFTEEDLPGYKAKSKARAHAANTGLPPALWKQKADRVEKPKWDRNKPYYRKAIPKKTRIYGKITYELNCAPVPAEQRRILLENQEEEAARTRTLRILDRKNGQVLQVGTGRAAEWDQNFIKSQTKPTKAKKVEMKTIRIPENELLDKIFECFSRYQYWSLKSLRAELQQPEVYLRQTMEKVAVLNKTGRFANNWSLRPENVVESQNADAAPDAAEGESEMEDEDAEMTMENAL